MRHAFFRDVELGNYLDAGSELFLDRYRWGCYLAKFAVNTEPHAVGVLERFEVKVRRPHAEGIEQHFLQKLNDGGIFHLRLGGVVFGHRIGCSLVKLEILPDDAFHRFSCRGARNFHQAGKLVVFGDDPIHTHLRGKLDFFSRLLIGRIGCGDDQTIVAFAQHHNSVSLANLVVKQPFGQTLNVDRFKVKQRSGKGGRHGVRQIHGRHGARAGQLCNKTRPACLGFTENILCRFLAQLACYYQRAPQPRQGH